MFPAFFSFFLEARAHGIGGTCVVPPTERVQCLTVTTVVAMGATSSTARLDRLTALGFSVAEARLALEHTNGDVDRAILCLLAKRRRDASAGQGLANRVNAILRTQRPWPEFFERFLWPEHLQERLSTNLV